MNAALGDQKPPPLTNVCAFQLSRSLEYSNEFSAFGKYDPRSPPAAKTLLPKTIASSLFVTPAFLGRPGELLKTTVPFSPTHTNAPFTNVTPLSELVVPVFI